MRESKEESERNGEEGRYAGLKWKLDRTSYYLLIATVLNEREKEKEEERGVRESEMGDASGHFLISDTGRPEDRMRRTPPAFPK